jgi:hypothetical protein
MNIYELSISLSYSNDKSDVNAIDFECEFLPKLINSCESAVQLNCSLILAWIFRSIAKKVFFNSFFSQHFHKICLI